MNFDEPSNASDSGHGSGLTYMNQEPVNGFLLQVNPADPKDPKR